VVPRIKLGELLVRAGVIDDAKLQAALAEQSRWGGRLGATLVAMGFVGEDLLVKALSKQLAVPVARLDTLDVPGWALARVDRSSWSALGACPERFVAERSLLVVAVVDPLSLSAVDDLARRLGVALEVHVATERAVQRALDHLYGVPERPSADAPTPFAASPARTSVAPPAFASPAGLAAAAASTASVPTPESAPVAARSSAPSANSGAGLGGELEGLREVVRALEASQHRQWTAIRVLSDLLVERGLLPRDELSARLGRRSS
jgi:hypothetical protein